MPAHGGGDLADVELARGASYLANACGAKFDGPKDPGWRDKSCSARETRFRRCPKWRSLRRLFCYLRHLGAGNVVVGSWQLRSVDVSHGPYTLFDGIGCRRHILRVHQTKAFAGFTVQPPTLVHQAAFPLRGRTVVCSYTKVVANAPDPGGAFQFNVDALWSILEKPLPTGIGGVIALYEVNQLGVLQQTALGTG